MSFDTEKARAGRRPFAVVEIDLDYCSRTYGISPCAAALGVTGSAHCYNTRATCQDSANYAKTTKTYRFCSNVADVPRELDALPFLESVSINPTKLQIGAGLGERGSVTVQLRDGKHNDVGIDAYVNERRGRSGLGRLLQENGFLLLQENGSALLLEGDSVEVAATPGPDPLTRGTMFGRLLARNPYYLGRVMRVKTGYLAQGASGAWEYGADNFQTRTYFLEKMAGPDPSGRVTIVAKDLLKLADDERAQAPRPAMGRLATLITAGEAVPFSRDLLPAGIGNAWYGASGKVRINGEVFTFTRAGDTVTFTARAQNFTTAAEHAADDAVQECLVFSSQRAHQIIYTLLTDYADIDANYIPLTDWAAEDATYNVRQYNAVIAEPTGVNQLIGEICEQGPSYVWWDDVAAEIIYRTLRPASSASTELTDDDSFIAGSAQVQDRLDQRISECWVYFGQRNPTESVDKRSNYAATHVLVGDGETVNKYNQPRVKEIFARFLTSSARTFASEIAESVIQRYDEVPKQIDFSILPKDDVETGDLFNVTTRLIQGADGGEQSAVFQVLSVAPDYESDTRRVSALQERYVPSSSAGQRLLVISADELDYNLRTKHDELYAAPTAAVTVRLVVESDVVVGSSSSAAPALTIGEWPAGSTITVVLKGRIEGAGGRGGDGGGTGTQAGTVNGGNGSEGGIGLYTRTPLTVDCTSGTPELWGGGGGGGGSSGSVGGSGGGGAGELPGETGTGFGFSVATRATRTTGGAGYRASSNPNVGGNGGGPGEAGAAATGANGGAGGDGGDAIDGFSHITFTGSADIRGAQVN